MVVVVKETFWGDICEGVLRDVVAALAMFCFERLSFKSPVPIDVFDFLKPDDEADFDRLGVDVNE